MKSKTAKIIVIVSLLVLFGLIITQFLIIRNSLKIENENRDNVEQKRILQKLNFKSEVTIALTKVRDKLIYLNKENSNIYLDPVKQIQDNYFVVSFYDTIPKLLLENLIKEEFAGFGIEEEYKIGIYDCFIDSIIFDKFTDENESKIPLKWDIDGYYFGVYFTETEKIEESKKSSLPFMLFLATLVISIVGLFSFYLANSILKQKKISSITYDFINNMTHELKTPISTISLSTDVLMNTPESKENKNINKYLAIIKTENKRLENQVERVLRIAKLDKGSIKLNFEEIDLHEVINTCVETFNVPIQNRNGKIITKLNATKTMINGDIIHITNIIYNLLDNANKYSKKSPEILIETINLEDKISVSISDKGIGINKEEIKDIFNKFYRVPTGDIHNVKGFGLGLYYVKQMVEKHYGTIELNSIYGEGSKFTLIFPLKKNEI